MRFFGRLWDLFITALLFTLMLFGYGLHTLLYPFYRCKKTYKAVLIVFLVLTLAAACGYYLFLKAVSSPRNREPVVESVVIVERGSTLQKIVRLLERNRIIDSPLQFKVLSIMKGETRKLKAGRYKFTNQMSVSDIAAALAKGTTYNNMVLIPEGFPSWEIASLLSKSMEIDSAEFDSLVNDSVFAESLGVDARSLEGYLFPDTYLFSWDAKPREIIREMVGRFHAVYAKSDTANPITTRYTRHQIVTLASIVEGEARVDAERPLIAGVFYNRLRKRMPLGADPTVCYVLRKFGRPLTKRDLQVESPYNTRRFPGLPPGPIVSPGAASLSAAINPAETDMLYFVAKDDGSREHFFTATHIEHNRMKQVAQANRQRIVNGDAPVMK